MLNHAVNLLRLVCIASVVAGCSSRQESEQPVRITTWNPQWFPNGSPKEATPAGQTENIKRAADVVRELNPDILLLQEVKDYDACARLAGMREQVSRSS
jgi:endonuclease/exonuclease/phosphatase family metal-dependent hydrolase